MIKLTLHFKNNTMFSRLSYCLLFLVIIGLPALAQTPANNLHFTSGKGQMIAVYKGTIFVNGKRSYELSSDNIVYKSKRNRLVEDKGNVFLFLEVTAAPSKNRLYVFGINYSKADSLMSAIASDIKDFDQDGYLEFGGSETVPVHPAADSLYYAPAKYYEVKKGAITFDAEYTEKADKKANGVYIATPTVTNANGFISIPKRKGRS
ncbi:hypothetical protein [Chitinophaga nivalis]|uniref:Uncharacterized protein n=1 Tax=Chitinophaga nivalis TaxID=2991709 RepID=A0ABT3IKE0_9BACT|nr:hypothetical protein [Chitinophaga nivalis]MCW3465895.1 hypothetical protein [Chitinophaga nivalis]MCW3484414.1 hypothetical protein [Chitinophaga nivalis]